MRTRVFLLVSIAVAAVVFFAARMVNNDYVFFAGYTILQFIVLATAWNILGGYTGYVNFGSAAFFAMGAYSTVFFHKAFPMPIPILILIGGVVSGVVGFGMGYLTLRLRARSLRSPRSRSPSCCKPSWSTGIMSEARAGPTSSGPTTSHGSDPISNTCSC